MVAEVGDGFYYDSGEYPKYLCFVGLNRHGLARGRFLVPREKTQDFGMTPLEIPGLISQTDA
jgi:hypothetical protein